MQPPRRTRRSLPSFRTLAAAFVAAAAFAGASASVRADEPAAGEFFERRVRPLLAERCFECHSRAAGKAKGGLRLDDPRDLFAGGDTGPPVVPGRPDESLLIRAVLYADEDVRMPPDGKLPEAEIADLTRWIAEGAVVPDYPAADAMPAGSAPAGPSPAHPGASASDAVEARFAAERAAWWAFQPVRDPEPPAVRDESRVANPIDRFLQARLEAEGVEPAPVPGTSESDKRTLIRRATFDLTGLPPTPEEIDDFLADDSPDAFARVVDRLLASPRYGERWGRHWLDVVRYTDSFDSRGGPDTDPVEIFRYRDWVVRSFNEDLPFDRFLKMHVAGDVLAARPGEYDPDAVVATGALAIGNWPQGDADKEKMVTDIVDDQIDLVSRGFMGLTVACARCHDHKFDPISTRDYHALAGIFFSSTILPGPGEKTAGSPILHVPLISPEDEAARTKRDATIGRLQEFETTLRERETSRRAIAALSGPSPDALRLAAAAREWRALSGGRGAGPPAEFAAARGLDLEALRRWNRFLGFRDPRILSRPTNGVGGHAALVGVLGEGDVPSFVVNPMEAEAAFATIRHPARSAAVHPSPDAGVEVEWTCPEAGDYLVEWRAADADDVCGDGFAWRVSVRRAGASETLGEGAVPNGGSVASEAASAIRAEAGERVAIEILPGGEYTCDTTAIDLTIASATDPARVWNLTRDALAVAAGGSFRNPFPDAFGEEAVWTALDPKKAGASPTAPEPLFLSEWKRRIGDRVFLSKTRAPESDGAGDPTERAVEEALASIFADVAAAEGAAPDSAAAGAALRAELLAEAGPLREAIEIADLPPGPRLVASVGRAARDRLLANAPPPIEKAVAIREGGVPGTPYEGFHNARIHIRGSYNSLGDEVPRGFPALFPGDVARPVERGSGRLELAERVASADNPLTARVMVNRIWKHHFGAGIVRTPGNFGKLGEPPSHPELLDWLASRFVESGWSVKAMHRLAMLSEAYRRSSAASEEALERDPDNRLFGRANRRRLEAEAIRDSLLAVSGALDETRGGPAFADFSTPRRTLYLRTTRSDRATFGALFDAADSAAIADVRVESTVAPQALFLMNHPFANDAAKRLAERLRREAGENPERLVARACALLFGREPSAREREIGTRILLAARPAGAEAEGDADGVESLCRVLLCANEFVYVD